MLILLSLLVSFAVFAQDNDVKTETSFKKERPHRQMFQNSPQRNFNLGEFQRDENQPKRDFSVRRFKVESKACPFCGVKLAERPGRGFSGGFFNRPGQGMRRHGVAPGGRFNNEFRGRYQRGAAIGERPWRGSMGHLIGRDNKPPVPSEE